MDDTLPMSESVGSATIDGRWLLTHAIWRNSHGSCEPETGVNDLTDVDANDVGGFDDRGLNDRLMGFDWGREPGYSVDQRGKRAPKPADPKKKAKRKMQAASRRRNRN